jgi:tetratricopeptide (TPR) repeat protein
MKNNISFLLDRVKQGDLGEEIANFKILEVPELAWFSSSEFKEVERELKEALTQAKKRGGPDHPATALVNYFLGDAYMRHGSFASAEFHLLGAAEIWAHTDADNYRGAIHRLLDLAQAYGESGKLSDSVKLGGAIVDSVKSNLSEGDSLIVSALADLAAAVLAQGRTSKAENLSREALSQGERNPETLSSFGPRILMNLAGVSTARREFSQAELHLDRALEIAEAAAIRNAGHVLEILCSKAKVCAALGKVERLDDTTAKAQKAYQAAWESDPEMVVPLMLDLMRLLGQFGRDVASEKIYKRLTEDTAAVMKAGNEQRCLGIIDAWLNDFNVRGGDPRIGEIWRENKRRFEEYFRRMGK